MKSKAHLIIAILPATIILSTLSHCEADKGNSQHTPEVIRDYADRFIKEPNRSGLSMGVYLRGVTYFYNCGEVTRGSHISPTPETIYEIGSITKTFTGILLAHAVMDKKLRLDDDIRKYLPGEYPNLAFQGQPIRVIDLANQASGLPQNSTIIPNGASADDIVRLEKANDTSQFLNDLHSVRLDHAPGRDLQYSNAGFGLLGIILEEAYGSTFETLVRKHVAGPLGMRDTAINLAPSQQKRFAPGYSEDGALRPSLLLGVPASGGLRSTVRDLMRYVQANATARRGPIFLSQQLTAGSPTGGVGLGWDVDQDSTGNLRISHDGGTLGYSSYMAVLPTRSFGIALLTNQSGVLAKLRKLGDTLTVHLQN
jgi:D-alanyl-D-alanine-carboxypeptidase/D-alanyl-D-alanine-endopeptidase